MRINLLALWTLFCLGLTNGPMITRASAQTNQVQAPVLPIGRQPLPNHNTSTAAVSPIGDPSWTSDPGRTINDAHSFRDVIPAQYTSKETPLPGLNRSTSMSQKTSVEASQDNSRSAGGRPLQPPSEQAKDKEKRSSGSSEMFISVVSSLMIVIGLMLGAAWCYRRAMPGATGSLPKQVIQILGRTPLAPRQQLVLIRFGQKLVLVSNLHGEVRTISEITDPLEVDRMAGMCESAQAGSISDSFRTVLHNIGRNG